MPPLLFHRPNGYFAGWMAILFRWLDDFSATAGTTISPAGWLFRSLIACFSPAYGIFAPADQSDDFDPDPPDKNAV